MVGTLLAGPRAERPGSHRRLVRWLYSNNPFYVISAGLVFLGLRSSFAPVGRPFESGMLMLGLASYAGLLAVTAWALIRLGQVWDDLRTVLLLVVLMFLAISVSFDYTLVAHPWLGRTYYLGGLVFAMAISEGLLRGIHLRLPALFRVPYHLILSLFFLYPLVLGHLSDHPDSPGLQWALFGFSTVAGLVFLSLLPAIRRGPDYVAANGSPWRWPLYPWVLFGLLACGVLVRSYWVCVSFHFVLKSRSVFGPYMLVPFLLCLCVLLLEIGRSTARGGIVRLALAAPIGLLALSLSGHRVDPVYTGFLSRFESAFGGTPAYLTLLAVAGFYGIMACRRVRLAADGLILALAGFAWIGPATLGPSDLTPPQPWPLLASALLLTVRGGVLHDPVRSFWGGVSLLAATWIALPDNLSGLQRVALPDHGAMAAALILGLVSSDRILREFFQVLGLLLLGFTGAAAMVLAMNPAVDVPGPILWAYAPLAGLVAVSYGARVAHPFGRRIGLALWGAWSIAAGREGYLWLRTVMLGLDRIALGMAFFALALLISMRKAGLLPDRWTRPTLASDSAPSIETST